MKAAGAAVLVAAALPAYAYFYNVGSIGFWLPLYVREAGWSYTLVTMIATLYFVAVTLATPLAGIASDVTRRPGLVLSAGMGVVALTSFALPHTGSELGILVLRSLQGAGLAVGLPVALGSLSLLKGVRAGVVLTALSSGIGMASAAIVSGFLASSLGFGYVFYLSGFVALLSMLVGLFWRPPPPPRGEGFLASLVRVPWEVAVAMAAIAVRNFFASGVFSVIAIIFNKIVGVSYLATGVALAVNPLVQSISSPILQVVVRGRAVVAYAAGLSGTSIAFLLYLASDGLVDLIVAQAVLGFFYVAAAISGNTIIVSLSPDEIRYTASSLYTLAFNTGWIFGTLVAGRVMDSLGVETWVLIASVGTAFSGIIPLAMLRSRRARKI